MKLDAILPQFIEMNNHQEILSWLWKGEMFDKMQSGLLLQPHWNSLFLSHVPGNVRKDRKMK